MKRASRNRLAAVCAVALALSTPTTWAQARLQEEPEPGWQLRFYAAAVDFEGDIRGYGADAGGGVGIHGEYRVSRRVGLDLGAFAAGGVNVWTQPAPGHRGDWLVDDTLTLSALMAGVDIHLTPESELDLYLSPLIALVQYSGLVFHTGPDGSAVWLDVDEDFAIGGALGLGVPIGERPWSFQACLMRLESGTSSRTTDGPWLEGSGDVTVVGFGFGYRFGSKRKSPERAEGS